MARTRMDSHSRWDEVKAKRRPPSEEARATVERELAEDERAGGFADPGADGAGAPDTHAA
jgi:hypothetical protein